MMTPAEIRDAQKALIRGGARIRVTGVLDAPTLTALRAHVLKTRPGSEYQPGPTPAIMQGLEPLQSPPANDPGQWMSAAQGLPSGFGDPNVSPQGMSLPGGMGAPNPWDLMGAQQSIAAPMQGGMLSDMPGRPMPPMPDLSRLFPQGQPQGPVMGPAMQAPRPYSQMRPDLQIAPPNGTPEDYSPSLMDRFAATAARPPVRTPPYSPTMPGWRPVDAGALSDAPNLTPARPPPMPQPPAQQAPAPNMRDIVAAAIPNGPMVSQAPIPAAQQFADNFAPPAGAAQAMPPLAQLLASPEMANLVGALPARPGTPMPADQPANAPVVEAQSAPAPPVRMIRPGRPQMATPEVGDIVAGYRFLGGNPRDKRSWRKL